MGAGGREKGGKGMMLAQQTTGTLKIERVKVHILRKKVWWKELIEKVRSVYESSIAIVERLKELAIVVKGKG
jgi:hypothetical protein